MNDGGFWTLQSLKEHYDQRFAAAERAIDKAMVSLDIRLEEMNQFRAQLERKRSNYVTADKHDELDEKIDELRRTYVTVERFEAGISAIGTRVGTFESWQNKIVGALLFVGLILPIISALIVYWATHP